MTVPQNPMSAYVPPRAPRRASQKDAKTPHSSSLSQLCDIFPDWARDDLALILAELGGDVELVVNRISEGHVTQWSETGKKVSRKGTSGPVSRGRVDTGSSRRNAPTVSSSSSSSSKTHEASKPEKTGAHETGKSERAGAHELNKVEKAKAPSSASKISPAPKASGNPAPQEPLPTQDRQPEKSATKRYTSIKSGQSQSGDAAQPTSVLAAANSEEPAPQQPIHDAEKPVMLAQEESMSQFVSSIVGEDELVSEAPKVRPIVEMPKGLSSRISSAAIQQPVVVLPLKATVRPGLSVSFGASHLPQQQQQQQPEPQRPFDDVVASVKPAVGPRYTSTGVEAALLSSPRVDQAATAIRRSQPIQRPGQSFQREAFMTPPPGLASEPSSGIDMAAPYGKGSAVPGRYNTYSSYGHEEIIDSAPGFQQQYYGQAARSHYQQHAAAPSGASYARSMEFNSKPSGDQARANQVFSAPWASYSAPQAQHGSYYPNTHYSQHIYSDPASYSAQAQQPQQQSYGMPSGARYTQHAAGHSYSGAQNGYAPGNFYNVNEQGYGNANPNVNRPSHSQVSRQMFPDAFAPAKNDL